MGPELENGLICDREIVISGSRGMLRCRSLEEEIERSFEDVQQATLFHVRRGTIQSRERSILYWQSSTFIQLPAVWEQRSRNAIGRSYRMSD